MREADSAVGFRLESRDRRSAPVHWHDPRRAMSVEQHLRGSQHMLRCMLLHMPAR